jgi:hypothetical protein
VGISVENVGAIRMKTAERKDRRNLGPSRWLWDTEQITLRLPVSELHIVKLIKSPLFGLFYSSQQKAPKPTGQLVCSPSASLAGKTGLTWPQTLPFTSGPNQALCLLL